MLDANCAWSLREACEAARMLREVDLPWLEEPVWPPADLRALERVGREKVALAAGENCGAAPGSMALAQVPDLAYCQPNVTKTGRLSGLLDVREICRQSVRQLAPHSPYYGPGLPATLHACAAFPETKRIELYGLRLEAPVFPGWEMRGPGNVMRLPEGPGLGADPDIKSLQRYRV